METPYWQAVTNAIADLESTVLDDPRLDSDLIRTEGLRYLTRILSGGIPYTVEGWDHLNPRLYQFLSPIVQFGLPAADCHYAGAATHSDYTYRITGARGTSRMFDVETRSGHMARLGMPGNWQLIARRNDLEVNADGTIDVVLSREEQPGNWIELADGPGTVMVRQYYYDWLTEEPARLRIERDGEQWPAPSMTAERIQDGLDLFVDWLKNLAPACRAAGATYYDAPAGTVAYAGFDIGWTDLQYGRGHYECGPDEAVILELAEPQAPYWGVQLGSHYWDARDWHVRQSSLNGHQAAIDDDGMFRAVISHRDPGVANWLDAGGNPTGIVALRICMAESIPDTTLRTVAFDDVADALPQTTTLVSPSERAVSVRERYLSVFRRGCD